MTPKDRENSDKMKELRKDILNNGNNITAL